MPKEQNVKRKYLNVRGPPDGDFCPEKYMDVPILTDGLISVTMSFKWMDQGFGSQKGQIWLRLLRSDGEIADSRYGPSDCEV